MISRRLFVRSSIAAGVVMNSFVGARAASGSLSRTPRDYEGPFYPDGPRNRNSDLITGKPRAKVLLLAGQVVNTNGEPLAGALFDFWQTDPLGRYNHPRDSSTGERWSDFLYWGEARTDDSGAFQIRTYVPGAYARRPAHIHFKVWSNRKSMLTSQIYFAELGGPKRAARSKEAATRQTVNLLDLNENEVRGNIQIVV